MSGATPDAFPDKVLIVDDEEHARELFERILHERDIVSEVASNGEEALMILERVQVGCVVSDKNLPGMSGLDVLKRAGELQPHCARILVTGFASKESVIAALRLGADDYLEKPFDSIDIVGEKVELAMKNRRARFENDRLTRSLREAHRSLAERNRELDIRRTESELFDEVLEFKTREAVEKAMANIISGLEATAAHIQKAAKKEPMNVAVARDLLNDAYLTLRAQCRRLARKAGSDAE
jgi:FixJ family two-component response regulator